MPYGSPDKQEASVVHGVIIRSSTEENFVFGAEFRWELSGLTEFQADGLLQELVDAVNDLPDWTATGGKSYLVNEECTPTP